MSDFTLKERLVKALKGEEVDKAPAVSVTQTGTTELMDASGAEWPEAHTDAAKMVDLAMAAHEVAGLEAVRFPYCLTVLAEAMGCEVNMGTRERQPSVTEHPYPKGVSDLAMPENFLGQGRIPVVIEAAKLIKEKVGDDLPIIAGMEGPITLASDLSSVKKFMKWSIKKPEDFETLLDFATDAAIEYANALVDAGADIISVADPVASPDLMSPASFDQYLKPRLTRFAESVNAVTILHICGNIAPILGMAADCKFEGISMEEKVEDVKAAKEIVGDRASLVGNVSSPFVILAGTTDNVKAAAKLALENGINVLAPGCGIAPKSPTENIKALIEARDEYFA